MPDESRAGNPRPESFDPRRRLARRRAVRRAIDLPARSPRGAVAGLFLVTLASAAAVGSTLGLPQPQFHDETSYLLAADTFARGRLTNPTHPFWVHFETFHVLHRPVYASKYEPGQGLALAVGQWLGHPVYGAWLAAAFMCAAILWMLQSWLPARWALLGGLITLLHFGVGGYWAQGYWGGALPAAGGALLFGGARRLHAAPRRGPAIWLAIGIVILGMTRPYEGAAVGLLVVGLLALRALRDRRARRAWLSRAALPALVIVGLGGAALGVYHRAVSGSAWKLPYYTHMEQYSATPNFLFVDPPDSTPAYRHPRLRQFHLGWERGKYDRQQTPGGYLRELGQKSYMVVKTFVFGPPTIRLWYPWPSPLLLPLLALPFLWRGRPWVRFALLTIGTVAAAELLVTYLLGHYLAPVLGPIIFLIALGLRKVVLSRPLRRRWHLAAAGYFLALGVSLFVALQLHALVGRTENLWFNERRALSERLVSAGGKHLILVEYAGDYDIHEEWVYNGSEIEAQPIVWARAISEQADRDLARHFADRTVWRLFLTPLEMARLERWDPTSD